MPLLTLPFPMSRDGGALPQDTLLAIEYDQWVMSNRGKPFRWFDIGCGEGEMLPAVRRVVAGHPTEDLQRWCYSGHELYEGFAIKCREMLDQLGMDGEVISGRLDLMTLKVPKLGGQFDAVTLVNALHEIGLHEVPDLFLDMLLLRANRGFIFVFDIAELPHKEAELGATPWRRSEMTLFLRRLADLLDFPYQVNINDKPSRNQSAWNFTIRRELLPANLSDTIVQRRPELLAELHAVIGQIFSHRRDELDKDIVAQGRTMRELQLRPKDDKSTTALQSQQMIIDVRLRDRWACEYSLRQVPQVAHEHAA